MRPSAKEPSRRTDGSWPGASLSAEPDARFARGLIGRDPAAQLLRQRRRDLVGARDPGRLERELDLPAPRRDRARTSTRARTGWTRTPSNLVRPSSERSEPSNSPSSIRRGIAPSFSRPRRAARHPGQALSEHPAISILSGSGEGLPSRGAGEPREIPPVLALVLEHDLAPLDPDRAELRRPAEQAEEPGLARRRWIRRKSVR